MTQYISPYETIRFLNEKLALNLKTPGDLSNFIEKHPKFPPAYDEHLQPLSKEETVEMLEEVNLIHH